MLSIIVAFPKLEDAKKIRTILLRNDYDVAAVCTSGMQVCEAMNRLDNGIVITGYKLEDMNYMELKECMKRGFRMLLVVSSNRIQDGIDSDISYLITPLNKQSLLSTISDISESYYREKKTKSEKRGLRNEEDKKIIMEAKNVLMTRNNLTEPEAHRYIQKMSMDSGSSLLETAQKVLTLFAE